MEIYTSHTKKKGNTVLNSTEQIQIVLLGQTVPAATIDEQDKNRVVILKCI